MGNMFGVKEGVPYARWPTRALETLKNGLDRNGELSAAMKQIEQEVREILADRQKTGVDYSDDGVLHHPV